MKVRAAILAVLLVAVTLPATAMDSDHDSSLDPWSLRGHLLVNGESEVVNTYRGSECTEIHAAIREYNDEFFVTDSEPPDGWPNYISTVSLIRDDDLTIIVDPGMVAHRSLILDPLAAMGIAPDDATDVIISHHHPDHTINIALFPDVRIHDYWAIYHHDQ
jgi:glyoxylase-like metal-dependent hydrolase (beta-lactamase superfamily II)